MPVNRRRLLWAGAGAAGAAGFAAWRFRTPHFGPADSLVRSWVEGGVRVVESNGLPDHATGDYPNHNDPFAVLPQRYRFQAPVNPARAERPTQVGFWRFGVAVNGVPFDPAGPYWRGDRTSGWQFEVLSPTARGPLGLDLNHAHVQPGGGYHYHGLPTGLLWRLTVARRGVGRPGPVLLGFAADGFPVYGPEGPSDPSDPESPARRLRPSYRLRAGSRRDGPMGAHDGTFVEDFEYVAGLGDLDDCNGRVGVTPEYPGGTYHYVLTDDFPFIPRLYRGTPDRSFRHGGNGPGPAGVPPTLRNYRPSPA